MPQQNLQPQLFSITHTDRAILNGHKGKVIWFTGLSGSGKSTLANALEVMLHKAGMHSYLLDGDNIRCGLNSDLDFSDNGRIENIRRVAEVSKLMADAGLITVTAFISPFIRERELAKKLIGHESFVEVYVSTSLETCEARDPKGLYKRARAGEIKNFSGISSPYEPPISPQIEINGSDLYDSKIQAQEIFDYIMSAK